MQSRRGGLFVLSTSGIGPQIDVTDGGETLVVSGKMAEEQALVLRAQAGSRDAFTTLYERYERKIHTYLRFHLHGRTEAAEDLAAEVFLKAFEKLGSFTFSGVPFSAWLYRIAHNQLIDHIRAAARKQSTPLDDLISVDDPAAGRALDLTLEQERIASALKVLTDDQRRVIEHRFFQDRSIADTARLMGKNDDAVKQLQVRALRNMRQSFVP
jgi:RNA polymerase sigma-70 factor, ECF subfamily